MSLANFYFFFELDAAQDFLDFVRVVLRVGVGDWAGGAFGIGAVQLAATFGASAVVTVSAIITFPKQEKPRGGGVSPHGWQMTAGGAAAV